uniref:Flavonoid 3'5'-hydroxylase n=1 Tax=Pericallis cruenta TaxID=98709 RepID=Q304Q5_PERCU|nr:flavonoid 3'5'-hydroxylase [Pericallis cruenta]
MSILTLICTFITGLMFYGLVNLLSRRASRLPPGPTPWPIIGNLMHLGKLPHHSLADLAKKYGPLIHVRLGSVDVVVASSASVAGQFLKVHDANFANRPPNSGAKHMAYNYHDMVFAPYGPRWRMLRKMCSMHLFSAKALTDFRQVRQEEVTILTRVLARTGQSAVKLDQQLNVCFANTLSRMMLDRRVFGDGDPKADDYKDMVVELMTLAGQFNIGDYIPWLDLLDLQGIVKRMKKVHSQFDSFLDTIIDEHTIGTGRHVDMLSTMISLKDNADGEGGKLSFIEIKALLLNLFSAGTDTSSSTVEWGIAELIRHPQLMKQAQEEMDIVVGKNRLVTEMDISQLTFLQAIVKETFRLHPATPLSLPRIASESCEVKGYHVPKGSILFVNVWAIARQSELWTDPLEFRPGRFLIPGEKPNVEVKPNDFEIVPFGGGRRICAGMSLGLRMVNLLIATLVQAFDWELANGLEPEKLNMEEVFGISLQRVQPLLVHPRPRLARHVYGTG